MSRENCTINHELSGWMTAAVWESYILCFVSSICVPVSIWCLSRCQRTEKAVKIQLLSLFILQLVICTITAPFVIYLYNADFFCWEVGVPNAVKVISLILYVSLLQAERLNFMVIGVYRAVAVFRPHLYQKMVTMKIVIRVYVVIFLLILPPCVAIDAIKFSFQKFAITKKDNPMVEIVSILYGICYLLPFIITVIAYTIMMFCVIRQKRQANMHPNRQNTASHITFTIRLIILTNLLLDGPHVILHLILRDNTDLGILVIHMIFYFHYLLEHIIFIGMNTQYRKAITDKMSNFVSSISASPEQPPCHSNDVEKDDKDTKTTESNL